MKELAIDQYGVIGNLRTCALIGTNGSIDFLCYPKHDSPSIFLRLLDTKRGGYFRVHPLSGQHWSSIGTGQMDDGDVKTGSYFVSRQQYYPQTNVLLTRFLSEYAVGQVVDYMPLQKSDVVLPWVMRHVEVVRGSVKWKVEVCPAFDYARIGHKMDIVSPEQGSTTTEWYPNMDGWHRGQSVLFRPTNGKVYELMSLIRYRKAEDDAPSDETTLCPLLRWQASIGDEMKGPGVFALVTLYEGQELVLAFREHPTLSKDVEETHTICAISSPSQLSRTCPSSDKFNPNFDVQLCDRLRFQTHQYWSAWTDSCKYTGRWRESVLRSALVLKLMTYAPTGAVIAAPTFGLPETVGGERNWDYRYSWVRDSAFTVYAFMRIGFKDEATDYWEFMQKRLEDLNEDGSLQIMYSIDGKKDLPESKLDHLSGYKDSKPVRIGNAAQVHLQLDIYGELLDAAYLFNKFAAPVSYDFWCLLRLCVNYVAENWDTEDMSIWETRGKKQNFTYSKIMCWVAIDRGLRLADKRQLPCPDRNRWLEVRDTIYEEVMSKCFNQSRKAFMQAYDSQTLDCACLIMPLCFFISPCDPRFLGTLKEIMKSPERGGLLINNLCLRYDPLQTDDGLTGDEGTFTMTTFWLVEALTRAGKYYKPYLQQAHFIFEQMLTYGNHLGLFSEEIARSGESLGNSPQAFSHIALISAAFNLDRTLSGQDQ